MITLVMFAISWFYDEYRKLNEMTKMIVNLQDKKIKFQNDRIKCLQSIIITQHSIIKMKDDELKAMINEILESKP